MQLVPLPTLPVRFAFSQWCRLIPLGLGLVVALGTAAATATAQVPKGDVPPPKTTPQPSKLTPKQVEAQQRKALARQKALEAQQKKAALVVLTQREAQVLRATSILLASANSDYGGHKHRAMVEVDAALIRLDRVGGLNKVQHQQRVMAFHYLHDRVTATSLSNTGTGINLGQFLSDAQLARAGALLGQLDVVLASNNQTPVRKPVQIAIREIVAALEVSGQATLKGREADALAWAYILLASANHDYNGYRVKAIHHVKEASKILEVDLVRNGAVELKVKALGDANVEFLAKLKTSADPTLHEPQALSDVQLLMADAIIQRVASSAFVNGQRPVLRHLGDANGDIGIALSIR